MKAYKLSKNEWFFGDEQGLRDYLLMRLSAEIRRINAIVRKARAGD